MRTGSSIGVGAGGVVGRSGGGALGAPALGPGARPSLAALDQPLGVAGELDRAQAEEDEAPLRRDREDARDRGRGCAGSSRGTCPCRISVSKSAKAAPALTAPSTVRAPRVTTSTSQNSAANGAKLLP